jgi:SAM-dependent methyltransferase
MALVTVDNLGARELADIRLQLIRATFNAAAAHFDDPPLFFWNHCGLRTVELTGISRGDAVLDVCCGTGAASLHAARRVGSTGHVVGIDIADRQLDKARAKATEHKLANVEFRHGDMAALDESDGSYDAVLCIFGLYFATDLPAALAELWRVVRPGGKIAITSWGRRVLEPAYSMYANAVFAQRPDFRPLSSPLDSTNTHAALLRVFADAGLPTPVITQEVLRRPMRAGDFWTVILGSGHRLLIDAMTPDDAQRVHAAFDLRMAEEDVREVACDVLYACARKR